MNKVFDIHPSPPRGEGPHPDGGRLCGHDDEHHRVPPAARPEPHLPPGEGGDGPAADPGRGRLTSGRAAPRSPAGRTSSPTAATACTCARIPRVTLTAQAGSEVLLQSTTNEGLFEPVFYTPGNYRDETFGQGQFEGRPSARCAPSSTMPTPPTPTWSAERSSPPRAGGTAIPPTPTPPARGLLLPLRQAPGLWRLLHRRGGLQDRRRLLLRGARRAGPSPGDRPRLPDVLCLDDPPLPRRSLEGPQL